MQRLEPREDGRLRSRSDRQGSGNVRLSSTSIRRRFGRTGSSPSSTCSRIIRFKPQGSGSFTAHQDLIRGGTEIGDDRRASSTFRRAQPWGCDAPAGTDDVADHREQSVPAVTQGPFPCLTYRDAARPARRQQHLVALLHADGRESFAGNLWNAFDAIEAVRYGPEWSTNVSLARNERLHRHRSRHAAGSLVGHPRLPKLRSSRRQLRHRSVVGRASRQRDRREPRLEHHRDRHRVGRLGRLVRSRTRRRARVATEAWAFAFR